MIEKYMLLAIKEANKAVKTNNIPVGVVIIKDNKIISKAYNKKNTSKNPLDHAEIIAIKKATKKLNNWYLNDCIMYVTLEPCDMCYGAIKESRIKKVYYLLNSKYYENKKNTSKLLLFENNSLSKEYEILLKDFFSKLR